MSHTTPGPRTSDNTGFTLVELLIVISIIALLIGILLPALLGAQNAAKKAIATSLNKNVLDGAAAFRAQNGRVPGYFPETAMGDMANADRGFTQMENMLLDLAGGIPEGDAPAPMPSNDYLEVGPYAAGDSRNVVVNTLGVGAADGPGFLILDADTLRPVTGQATDIDVYSGTEVDKGMPDVLDPWGMPLLAWRRDPGSSLRVPQSAAADDVSYFVETEYTPGNPRSGFYWNSNAGVLNSGDPAASAMPARAGLGEDMVNIFARSMIGGEMRTADDTLVLRTMAAFLGSPAFPVAERGASEPWRPAQPRGEFVVLSAGSDRVYFKPVKADATLSVSAIPDDKDKYIAYSPTGGAPTGGEITAPLESFDEIILGGG